MYSTFANYNFAFTDMVWEIPDNEECSELTDYLNNLSPEEYEKEMKKIYDYVYQEGRKRIIKKHLEKYTGGILINSELYEHICSELCETPKPVDADVYKGGHTLDFRGEKNNYLYKWISCGQGCCVTEEKYKLVNGEPRLLGAETSQYGDCESGPIPNWKKILKGCPPLGKIVSECTPKCDK